MDYRQLTGQFDRVVSVGMMEHVGIGHFDEYFLIRMVDGAAQVPESLPAPLERPEVSYQMDSETLRAMTSGEITGAEAFRRRRLKLKASFSDIMKLQSLDRL